MEPYYSLATLRQREMHAIADQRRRVAAARTVRPARRPAVRWRPLASRILSLLGSRTATPCPTC